MPTKRNKPSDTPSEDANNDRSGSDSTSSRHKKQKTNENTNDNTTELKKVTLKITYYDVIKGAPVRFDDYGPRINAGKNITDERIKMFVIDNFKNQVDPNSTRRIPFFSNFDKCTYELVPSPYANDNNNDDDNIFPAHSIFVEDINQFRMSPSAKSKRRPVLSLIFDEDNVRKYKKFMAENGLKFLEIFVPVCIKRNNRNNNNSRNSNSRTKTSDSSSNDTEGTIGPYSTGEDSEEEEDKEYSISFGLRLAPPVGFASDLKDAIKTSGKLHNNGQTTIFGPYVVTENFSLNLEKNNFQLLKQMYKELLQMLSPYDTSLFYTGTRTESDTITVDDMDGHIPFNIHASSTTTTTTTTTTHTVDELNSYNGSRPVFFATGKNAQNLQFTNFTLRKFHDMIKNIFDNRKNGDTSETCYLVLAYGIFDEEEQMMTIKNGKQVVKNNQKNEKIGCQPLILRVRKPATATKGKNKTPDTDIIGTIVMKKQKIAEGGKDLITSELIKIYHEKKLGGTAENMMTNTSKCPNLSQDSLYTVATGTHTAVKILLLPEDVNGILKFLERKPDLIVCLLDTKTKQITNSEIQIYQDEVKQKLSDAYFDNDGPLKGAWTSEMYYFLSNFLSPKKRTKMLDAFLTGDFSLGGEVNWGMSKYFRRIAPKGGPKKDRYPLKTAGEIPKAYLFENESIYDKEKKGSSETVNIVKQDTLADLLVAKAKAMESRNNIREKLKDANLATDLKKELEEDLDDAKGDITMLRDKINKLK